MLIVFVVPPSFHFRHDNYDRLIFVIVVVIVVVVIVRLYVVIVVVVVVVIFVVVIVRPASLYLSPSNVDCRC